MPNPKIHKIMVTLRVADWEALKEIAEQSDTPVSIEAKRAIIRHIKQYRGG